MVGKRLLPILAAHLLKHEERDGLQARASRQAHTSSWYQDPAHQRWDQNMPCLRDQILRSVCGMHLQHQSPFNSTEAPKTLPI
jgi:hypothetical protein